MEARAAPQQVEELQRAVAALMAWGTAGPLVVVSGVQAVRGHDLAKL